MEGYGKAADGYCYPLDLGDDTGGGDTGDLPPLVWTDLQLQWIACGTTDDGDAWCWEPTVGSEVSPTGAVPTDEAQLVVVPGPWAAMVPSYRLGVCGLRGNGEVWCWGPYASNAEDTLPHSISDDVFVDLVSGYETFCGVRDDGVLACWGDRNDGGVDSPTPEPIAEAGPWRTAAPGYDHTCAIKEDGSLWCWGSNTHAQLGLGDLYGPDGTDAPARVGTADDWVAISCGLRDTCGIRDGGSLWCWGDTDYGVLGVGVDENAEPGTPARVGEEEWIAVDTFRSTCAVRSDGVVVCWGEGIHPGADTFGLGAFTHVTADNGTACGVDAAGHAWCWDEMDVPTRIVPPAP